MRENVKVVIWGFGAMGGGMAKALLKRKGIEIVGVCDMHPERVGKDMYEVLGVERGDKFARIGLIRGLCDRLRPRQNVAIECSGLRVSARRGRLRAGALRIAFAQFPISHSGTLCCLDHGACRSVNKIASHRVPKLAPIQLHLGFGALIRHHADDQGYS